MKKGYPNKTEHSIFSKESSTINNKIFRSFAALTLLLCLLLSACGPAVTDPQLTTTEQLTTAEVPNTTAEEIPSDTLEESPAPEASTAPDGYERVPETTAEDEAGEKPETTRPAETEPEATTKPADTQPPTTKPTPTEPVTTKPAPTEPSTTKPAATQPATTVPVTTVPPTTVAPTTAPPATEPPAVSSGFKVHFIDVGQADAALVVCDGKTMLIDGGNKDDSNLIYSYLQRQGVSHLDYIIATHAHEDHVGGLSGALSYATAGTVYCPVRSYSSQAFKNFANKVTNQGKSLTIPSVGHSFSLGSATCTVLAVNTDTSDPNNTSIVLRIVYGSTSFLFTGDAEQVVEQAMLNRGVNLRSTVLKVGHHGSYTSTSYNFLRNVMPAYAIISCGKGNSYGHPHDEPLSRLRDCGARVFRTDMQGDIICTSNGSSVSFSVSRNWNADVFQELG